MAGGPIDLRAAGGPVKEQQRLLEAQSLLRAEAAVGIAQGDALAPGPGQGGGVRRVREGRGLPGGTALGLPQGLDGRGPGQGLVNVPGDVDALHIVAAQALEAGVDAEAQVGPAQGVRRGGEAAGEGLPLILAGGLGVILLQVSDEGHVRAVLALVALVQRQAVAAVHHFPPGFRRRDAALEEDGAAGGAADAHEPTVHVRCDPEGHGEDAGSLRRQTLQQAVGPQEEVVAVVVAGEAEAKARPSDGDGLAGDIQLVEGVCPLGVVRQERGEARQVPGEIQVKRAALGGGRRE